MSPRSRTLWVTFWIAAAGCAKTPAAPEAAPLVSASVSVVPVASAAAPAASASASPSASAAGVGPGRRVFDSPAAAFEAVLASKPRVLAVGEAHAQKTAANVPSATARFSESLLPLLKGRASALLVELWVADGSCGKKEKQVAVRQKEVSAPQAETNQNEFVKLGERSKALGIEPHILRPSCAEYDEILKAGPDDVDTMLKMISRLTAAQAKLFLERTKDRDPPPLLVAYGGALHNDLAPKAGREAWSFGPELHAATGGKYVELDLIVPEFIKASPSWQGLAWYPLYDPTKDPDKTTLFEVAPGSFAMIFPTSAPPTPQP
jgi:hypothetical protein